MSASNPGKSSKSVPDWVSQQYYRIGLLCASRPRPVLFLAVLTVIYACWPLLSVPIYIGRPATFVETLNSEGLIVSKPNSSLVSENPVRPLWMSVDSEPVAYVQQIIVKAMVHPYRKEELIKTGKLNASFDILLQTYKVHKNLIFHEVSKYLLV